MVFNSIHIIKSKNYLKIQYDIKDCCVLLLYLDQVIDYLKINHVSIQNFYIGNETIDLTNLTLYNIEECLLKNNNCLILLNKDYLFYIDIIIKLNKKEIFSYK
jgi:hypothetical protein